MTFTTRTGLLMGALMIPAALGGSTIAVALPSLAADLAFSRPQAAWVLAAYLLAQAMSVAIFGRLGDVRGGRASLSIGGSLAAAGTLAAVLATSFPVLVGGRLLQGAGAGAAWVAALGIAAARHEGADRARALGVATATLGIVSGAGSLIGGVLTDVIGWHAVVAIPALVLAPLAPALRAAPPATAAGARLDVTGAALVATLALALVLLLQTPSLDAGPVLPVAATVVAAAVAAALALRLRRVPGGFLPAVVLRSRSFVLGGAAILALCSSYFGFLFAAPQLLLEHHDWSATQIGLVLVPAALAGATAAQLVGRLITGRDALRLGAALAALSAAGLLLGGAADGGPVATVAALALVLSAFTAGQVAIVSRVPLAVAPEVRSVATGLFTLATLLGGAIGAAVVTGLEGPFGLAGAVAALALLPAAGAVAALGATPRVLVRTVGA